MEKEVTILRSEPTVVLIAAMKLMPHGIEDMMKWVGEHRPECLPDDPEDQSWRSLFPHDLTEPAKDNPESFVMQSRPLTDNELLVELAGRNCYHSFGKKAGKKTNSEYIKNTQQGDIPHLSIIYHAKLSFFFGGISRRVSHELIRNYVGADRDEEGSPCLTGDARVYGFRNTDTQTHSWTMHELYEKQKTPRGLAHIKKTKFRSVNSDGVLVPNTIRRVISSGVKPVFRVRTRSGRELKATACHRFITPHGEKRLRELGVGSRVTANGLPAWANKEWLERKYVTERLTRPEVAGLVGVSDSFIGKVIRQFGIEKPLSLRINRKPGHGKKGMHTEEGLARLRDLHLGEKNPAWKGDEASRDGAGARALRNFAADICWGCGTRNDVERHHLDENPWNNVPENIYPLCGRCHKAFHYEGSITVFSDEIVSIEALPAEETFDIEMDSAPHNFVANGLVVHNSQESTRFTHHYGFFVCPPKYLGALGQPGEKGEEDAIHRALMLVHFKDSMQSAYDNYLTAVELECGAWEKEHGKKPTSIDKKRIYEAASSFLPHQAETSFVWTTNPAAISKLVRERANNAADLEIQRFARKLRKVAVEYCPNLFTAPWMQES